MKIWLDDMREAPAGWTRFITAEDVMAQLILNPADITHVSLDNDLGRPVEGWTVAKLIAALACAGMLLRVTM